MTFTEQTKTVVRDALKYLSCEDRAYVTTCHGQGTICSLEMALRIRRSLEDNLFRKINATNWKRIIDQDDVLIHWSYSFRKADCVPGEQHVYLYCIIKIVEKKMPKAVGPEDWKPTPKALKLLCPKYDVPKFVEDPREEKGDFLPTGSPDTFLNLQLETTGHGS